MELKIVMNDQSPAGGHLGFSISPKSNNILLAACNDHSEQFSIPSSM
jgi:hypothetical protein